jgi:hypothetical protein
VAGLGHDRALGHNGHGRRGGQPRPHMPGVLFKVEPGRLGAAFHNQRHRLICQAHWLEGAVAVEGSKDRPAPNAGALEPAAERVHRAGERVRAERQTDLAALGFLVGLRAAQLDDEAVGASWFERTLLLASACDSTPGKAECQAQTVPVVPACARGSTSASSVVKRLKEQRLCWVRAREAPAIPRRGRSPSGRVA